MDTADQPAPPAEDTAADPAPEPPEQPPAPVQRAGAPPEQPPAPKTGRTRWAVYAGIAVGSALLGASLTVSLLWASGVLDRRQVWIEEVPRYIDYPSKEAYGPDLDAWEKDAWEKGAWEYEWAWGSKDEAFDPSMPSGFWDPDEGNRWSGAWPAPPDAQDSGSWDPQSPESSTAAAARAIPSIVAVEALAGDGDPVGAGSGVIISSDGYIVTNEHVVDGADSLKVVMVNGDRYPAELVGADPLMDLAVLDVEADGLAAIEFGVMEGLEVGDPVVAVGNPFGLLGGPSFTAGVISAFDRTLTADYQTGETLYGLLQTDAPIASGSSGGALLDREGRLIGITTAAMGLYGAGGSLGFAVPVDLAAGAVDDLIADGAVRHAFLGIQGNTYLDENAEGVESPAGVEIQVLEDSALGEAGGRDGDVITALSGEPVKTMPVLVARLRSYRAGDAATITVDRGGDAVDLAVTFGVHPSVEAPPS